MAVIFTILDLFLTYEWTHLARGFVPGRPSQSTLVFVSKGRSQAVHLLYIYERSSLLHHGISYGCKKSFTAEMPLELNCNWLI